MDNNYRIQSVAKAMKVLECFAVKKTELGLTDISKELGLNKSNVYDILYTFHQLGYVQQNPSNGKYSLSIEILKYSYVVNEQLGYTRMVYDIIENLANDIQQIIYFAIPRGTDVFYLSNAHPQKKLKIFPYRNITGETCPMYCSALGKVMLAFSSPTILKQIESIERVRFTPNTIMTQQELEKEIKAVRNRGYGTDFAEHEYNVGAVAVPIFNHSNVFIGAISACGVCDVISQNPPYYAQKLIAASMEMKERLSGSNFVLPL